MGLQKEEIYAQCIPSAAKLLQFLNVASNSADSLAANSGIAPPDTRGNNGVSGANLRGQGSDATLVLLNGRRVATHGLAGQVVRSEEHTSEVQSLMRISYAVFCLKKKKNTKANSMSKTQR